MLTQDQILQTIEDGRSSECLDRRDYGRLAAFFDVHHWPTFGVKLVDGAEPPSPLPWTEENVLKQLASDVDFGFEKALDRRGISASFMHSVVKMWLWVLEDDLQHMEDYAQYGLPLFKAVALKYGLPDEIDGYCGDEHRFSADAGW